MQDDLLRYYNDELTYVRQLGNQFARDYPDVASKLALEQDNCNDPHVERMLEGFAFLAARIRKKIDDEFPEITEALLNVVYPHFLRPIPSFTIVQFELDPDQGKVSTGLPIDRHAVLESLPVASSRSSRESQGFSSERCKFQTVYPVTLWPITVTSAEWTTPDRVGIRSPEAVAAIRLQLSSPEDLPFSQFEMDDLCFYLDGERRLIHKLYELLCSRLYGVTVRDGTPRSTIPAQDLPPSALRPVGFEDDEGALPYPGRSFVGYRFLQEYFAFPEKFFFVRLSGLKQLWKTTGRRENERFGTKAEIIFLISAFDGAEYREILQMGVDNETFRLGCTPAVNLFSHMAEPILLDHTKHEYTIVPDVHRPDSLEIFSIDEVHGIKPQTRESIPFEPFFAFRHSEGNKRQETFFVSHRRASARVDDAGTETSISLLDVSMNPVDPEADTLDVRVTCTNRDLPARLAFRIGREALDDEKGGNKKGDLQLEGNSAVNCVVMLTKPTPTRRVALGKDSQWRLISHLSLNHLSLAEDGEALKQMLMLYNFDRSSALDKHIAGITRVSSKREFAPVPTEEGITFARGVGVDITFDEDQFPGGGVYLFASVLERFLGLYASINSFTRLRATIAQRKEVLYEWPPRAGQRILV